MDAADRGKKKRHCMLRNCVRGVSRNAYYVYSAKGVFHIHVIKACATKSNKLYVKVTKTVYYRCVYRIVYKNANSVISACKLYCVLVKLCLVIFKFDSLLFSVFIKGSFIIGLRIKKCNFHFNSSLLFYNYYSIIKT